jgi:hypothetical protein
MQRQTNYVLIRHAKTNILVLNRHAETVKICAYTRKGNCFCVNDHLHPAKEVLEVRAGLLTLDLTGHRAQLLWGLQQQGQSPPPFATAALTRCISLPYNVLQYMKQIFHFPFGFENSVPVLSIVSASQKRAMKFCFLTLIMTCTVYTLVKV